MIICFQIRWSFLKRILPQIILCCYYFVSTVWGIHFITISFARDKQNVCQNFLPNTKYSGFRKTVWIWSWLNHSQKIQNILIFLKFFFYFYMGHDWEHHLNTHVTSWKVDNNKNTFIMHGWGIPSMEWFPASQSFHKYLGFGKKMFSRFFLQFLHEQMKDVFQFHKHSFLNKKILDCTTTLDCFTMYV